MTAGMSFWGIETPVGGICEAKGCFMPGVRNHCDGDGRSHSHGMTHINGNTLVWLCREHGKIADAWWFDQKAGKNPKPFELKNEKGDL